MFRFSPSRLYTTSGLQRRSTINQTAEQLDNRRQYLGQQTGVGQNLSDRYLKLEKSLRGRELLSKQLDRYSQSSSSIPAVTQSNPLSPFSKPLQVFHGFEIPEKPKPPADDECCMSGCAVCVYDLYEETLKAHEEAVSSLQNSLSALNVPEDEWPCSIRNKGSSEPREVNRKEVVLNAFEEMEKGLKLKRQESEAQARIKAKRNQLIPEKEELSLGKAWAEFYEAVQWMFVNR